jgi:hypothetical protein
VFGRTNQRTTNNINAIVDGHSHGATTRIIARGILS